MKKIFLFTVAAVMYVHAFAQNFTLSGRVFDENQQPLALANVSIKKTFLGTMTNADGKFEIKHLSSGPYELEINYLGYEVQTKVVQLSQSTTVDFTLKPLALRTEEVVVSATRANNQTPVAQTTINRDQIKKLNSGGDVPFQLELTPSFVATSETGIGSGYTGLRIRGTESYRINVMVNGVPLNDSESHGVYWVNMPDFTSSVNSIQIQRGVGTSSNGSAAFGASINFQTISLEPKPYAHISSTIGSFNTFKENIAVGTGLINNHFAFDLRASKLNADAYIQRGFSDHSSLYASGTYYSEKHMIKALVMLGKERTGITWWGVPDYMIGSIRNFNPAGEYVDNQGVTRYYDGETDNYNQNHYQLLYSGSFSRFIKANVTLHSTTGKGYYEQYKSGEAFSGYGILPSQTSDSTITHSDLINQKWLDNVFYGAIADVNYHKSRIDATLGVSANQYLGDHFGNIKWIRNNPSIPFGYEWYNNKGIKTEYSAFLKGNYQIFEGLSVYLDGQIRSVNYKMEGPDDDLAMLDQSHNWLFFNPKAGLNYRLNNTHRLYFSFGQAHREPARVDLIEALKKGNKVFYETLNDFELGYELNLSSFALALNGFNMDYDNQLVMTGVLNSVGYPIMTNVKSSFRRGIELTAAYRFNELLEMNTNLTWSQNRILNFIESSTYNYYNQNDSLINKVTQSKELGETHLIYSPELISGIGMKISPVKNFNIILNSKYVGAQYFDNTSSQDRKLKPYFVINAGFEYQVKIEKIALFKLNFFVNNLSDNMYISNAYGGNWYENNVEKTWAYYFPQAGRNYMLKLTAEF